MNKSSKASDGKIWQCLKADPEYIKATLAESDILIPGTVTKYGAVMGEHGVQHWGIMGRSDYKYYKGIHVE